MTPVNDAPVLNDNTTGFTVLENTLNVTAQKVANTLTLSDPDSPANINNAYATISLVGGVGESTETLSVAAVGGSAEGAVQLSGSNVQVHHGVSWVTVGTVDVTLNGASEDHLQRVGDSG